MQTHSFINTPHRVFSLPKSLANPSPRHAHKITCDASQTGSVRRLNLFSNATLSQYLSLTSRTHFLFLLDPQVRATATADEPIRVLGRIREVRKDGATVDVSTGGSFEGYVSTFSHTHTISHLIYSMHTDTCQDTKPRGPLALPRNASSSKNSFLWD